MSQYTAIIKQDAGWWIGWIEEVPGVNCQGVTRDELMQNLHSALVEAITFNRHAARSEAGTDFEETPVLV